MTSFTRRLPKLELHAHLNGSIRRRTLTTLAATHALDPTTALILTRWPRTLSEAFSVFDVIHSCVTTLRDMERLAYEVAQDLDEDGIVYAEIRTTPRSMERGGLSEYVAAVLRGFGRYSREGGGVVVRVLLSIDRARHTPADADAIVDLALSHPRIVGIDLSGDPTHGDFETFLPALTRARSLGLSVTLHAAEVRNTDTEMSAMLNYAPDRFGHCCFVSPANLTRLRHSRIPIELCPTSNVLSNSVAALEHHHFGLHYQPGGKGSICCISTDDCGVFGSPLSNEYRLVMDAFGLGEREAFELAKRTLQATFLDGSGESDGKDWERIQAKFDAFETSWNWN
ncbi:related to adenosine deaminase [Sporisorium reilianum f. sp. reilianum]|uniref:Related to adenosine deaminase n=1 Tax=Sporisorium reilianum f. sp. reilianum TaxID=72559 RepID=A0A2N8U6D2_9BASI|nr:related to adenosine deaminase [Sporisorium reilianum f. sp. reilianum]